jgi:hypothetical protein
VTNETPGAKDLDKYKWGAAFVVMTVWLLIVLFGKVLIKKMDEMIFRAGLTGPPSE